MIQPRPNRIAATVRWLPWLAALSCGALAAYLLHRFGDTPLSRAKDSIGAIANLSAVFVGFAGTAQSILLTMQETSVIKLLRARNGYRFVVAHFIDTSVLGLCTAVCSVVALTLNLDKPTVAERVAVCVVFGLALGTAASVAQTTYYLKQLLSAKPEPEPQPVIRPEDLE